MIVGNNEIVVKKMINSDDVLMFEDVKIINTNEMIKKALLVPSGVLVTFSKSLEFFDSQRSKKKV